MSQQEAKPEKALSRGRIYGFLRRVFHQEVDQELLDWVRQQDRTGLWAEMGIVFNGALAGETDSQLVEDLAVEFCRLFIAQRPAGSPHESVHVGEARPIRPGALLWGDAASAVKDLYREAGFEINEDAHQMPDELSVELEFMEHLCIEEANAETDQNPAEVLRLQQLQERMLDEHLSQWAPPYARELKEASASLFYRQMLGLLADFIDWELEALEPRPG